MEKNKFSRGKDVKRGKLPIYDIDSSLILEIIFENPRQEDAKVIFYLSGYRNKYIAADFDFRYNFPKSALYRHKILITNINVRAYRLVVSSIVIGEVIYVINKENDQEYREKYIEALKRIILYHDLEIYRPLETSLDKISEVLSADAFFKFMDALIFACVLENKSVKFITFDSDFLQNKNLKERFKAIKIDDKC